MSLLSVEKASELILAEKRTYGAENVSFMTAQGRVLAQPIVADRDFPPFDRVTMDGIAIAFESFQNGQRSFKIASLQAAGEPPIAVENAAECIEIMTGAMLPQGVDTIIRYEDVSIENGVATIEIDSIGKGQNLHLQGIDRKQGYVLVAENQVIKPAILAMAASVGAIQLSVKKLPKVVIITSGDELVKVAETPLSHQIRGSNVYALQALLHSYHVQADHWHIVDDLEKSNQRIAEALENYDVILMSGGVSKGKKDFIPQALVENGVEKVFHQIAQRPGKPFWFGKKTEKLVFAFPGNPVSTFLCARRYFIPWLRQTIGLTPFDFQLAALAETYSFKPQLTYFLQVQLQQEKAALTAKPLTGNGSGDFANLVDSDAFLELPNQTESTYEKGQVFRVWRF